jgi:hypothetical protein
MVRPYPKGKRKRISAINLGLVSNHQKEHTSVTQGGRNWILAWNKIRHPFVKARQDLPFASLSRFPTRLPEIEMVTLSSSISHVIFRGR